MEEFQVYLDKLAPWLENPIVRGLGGALFVLAVIVVATKTTQNLVGKRIEDSGMRYRVRRTIAFFGYVAAGLALASTFSDSIGRLTVVLGGVGAGVAFALQEVIASVAGWAALSLGSFYSVGDRVQLGGTRGDVIAIGVLRTTLVEIGNWVDGDLYNGRVVRVANSYVFKEPVFNYSGDFPFLWDEMKVPVRFGSDRKLATKLINEALANIVGEFTEASKKDWAAMQQKYAVENASLDPMVTYIFNDNWVEYTIRYVVDFKRRRGIKFRLSEAILDAVEASEGRVQLASATFELVAAPPVRLETQTPKAA